jgi:alanyl-tRNA synthetase
LNQKLASFQAAELLAKFKRCWSSNAYHHCSKHGCEIIRNLHDSVKSKLEDAVIILAGVEGDKVSLIASVAKQYTAI